MFVGGHYNNPQVMEQSTVKSDCSSSISQPSNELPNAIPSRLTKLFNAKPSTFDLFFVQDDSGQSFVIKGLRNVKDNERKIAALKHEAQAYAALQSLGVSVPQTKFINQNENIVIDFGNGEVVELFPEALLMEYVSAQDLVDFVKDNRNNEAALQSVSKEFNSQFIHILLAGLYDLVGMRYDNVLVTPEGKLIFIDMTASFDKMHDGSSKAKSFVAGNWKKETPRFFGAELDPETYMIDPRFVMCDFTKLFDPKFSQTSMFFKSLTWEEIFKQVKDFDPSRVIEAENQGKISKAFADYLVARGNFLKNNLELLEQIWTKEVSPKIASVKALHEQNWNAIPQGTSYVPMQSFHFGITECSFAPMGTASDKPQEPPFNPELKALPNRGYLTIVKDPETKGIYLTSEGTIPYVPGKPGEDVKIIFKGLIAIQGKMWDGKVVAADDAIFDLKINEDTAARFCTYNPTSGGPKPGLQLVSKEQAIEILEANGRHVEANLIRQAFEMPGLQSENEGFVNLHPVKAEKKS